jgi:hypothetical protein
LYAADAKLGDAKLDQLHESGALSDDEFASVRAKLLSEANVLVDRI